MDTKLITFDEYAAREAVATERSEFHEGRVYPMSRPERPGSEPAKPGSHGTICFNLCGLIHSRLKATSCRGYATGTAFSPDAGQRILYPDAMIVCGEPSFYSAEIDLVLNPTVVFEVLSPTTEAYDRGKKLDLCAKADSLQEYILICQGEVCAERFTRLADGIWNRKLFTGLEATLRVESVPIEIPLAELYERL